MHVSLCLKYVCICVCMYARTYVECVYICIKKRVVKRAERLNNKDGKGEYARIFMLQVCMCMCMYVCMYVC